MKYGEKLPACRRWAKPGIGYPKHTYRFRIDPVPFVVSANSKYRRYFYCWCKKPKSTQERKLSFAYEGYVRGKRKSPNLPNAYDDYGRSDVRTRKSWKNRKIEKQWMKNAGVRQW